MLRSRQSRDLLDKVPRGFGSPPRAAVVGQGLKGVPFLQRMGLVSLGTGFMAGRGACRGCVAPADPYEARATNSARGFESRPIRPTRRCKKCNVAPGELQVCTSHRSRRNALCSISATLDREAVASRVKKSGGRPRRVPCNKVVTKSLSRPSRYASTSDNRVVSVRQDLGR